MWASRARGDAGWAGGGVFSLCMMAHGVGGPRLFFSGGDGHNGLAALRRCFLAGF
jgi:hypothetical protein